MLTGGTFVAPDSTTTTVLFGEDGLPQTLHAQGAVLAFANYRPGLVDVALLLPNGEMSFQRDVDIAEINLSDLTDGLANGLRVSADVDVTAAVVTFARATSAAVALATAAVAAVNGAAVGFASLTWDAGLAGTAIRIYNATTDWAQCLGMNAVACGVALVDTALLAYDSATSERLRDLVLTMLAALDTGSGDVQVTLKWTNTADLDLYVSDPTGETIYYGQPTSSSGGQLDVDDTDGEGPKNVFWPTGQAPRGTYAVSVDHYSGPSPASFTVLVQAFGHTRTFSGSVANGERVFVTAFSPDGIARQSARALRVRSRPAQPGLKVAGPF
ncbi:hypothetical protein BSZ37_02975 [Rubrivirga marina]|uniref:DUF2135 domain-containing protein n=1 Tax=Rubrivirga marina TaxID=1196024 RepID=A0A271IW63_9BACT|nr:hypothetical protein BSZ37_02975 [Rubrivirga marina]